MTDQFRDVCVCDANWFQFCPSDQIRGLHEGVISRLCMNGKSKAPRFCEMDVPDVWIKGGFSSLQIHDGEVPGAARSDVDSCRHGQCVGFTFIGVKIRDPQVFELY